MTGGVTVDFGGLAIAVEPGLLRPRSWTLAQSLWAEELLAELPPGPVLELCSGAGHIGLRAVARTDRHLVCVDADPRAVACSAANAVTAGLGDRVGVRAGRIGEVLGPDERFPLVIADPPWVPRAGIDRFPEDPPLAIDGGPDGLDLVRACVAEIDGHLPEGGSALLQVGPQGQAEAVAGLAEATGLHLSEVRRFGDRGAVVRLDRPAHRTRHMPGPSTGTHQTPPDVRRREES